MISLLKKIVTIIIFLLIIPHLNAQQTGEQQKDAIRNVQSTIQELIDDPFFERTLIALDIFDLTDSISLLQKNEKLLLRPASNMKLLTSASALFNLGEYYSFRTDLFHTGVIDGETLYGDLFVVGGFDPNFSVTDLDSLVAVIKSLSIKKIAGGVYGDISKKDSMYWGKGWMWDDDPEPSAPYLSPLNINDNSIEVFVKPGEIGGPAIIKLFPETGFVDIENKTVTVDRNGENNFLITRDWINKTNTILIEGKVRQLEIIDSSEYTSKVNLLYPERYFLTLFKEKLEEEGITIEKEMDTKRVEENSVYLATIHRSIDTVLAEVNKNSDNLDAEMLIYAMAYKDSGAPASSIEGLDAIKRFIDSIGLNSGDYSFADGSGVSHYNLVTAELLCESLKYMYYQDANLFNLFYKSLAIAGVDGTLKNRMKHSSAACNIHAKTGTIKGVSNLSGYVTTQNGHLLAFVILIQNFVDDYSTARKFQDNICEILAEYE